MDDFLEERISFYQTAVENGFENIEDYDDYLKDIAQESRYED